MSLPDRDAVPRREFLRAAVAVGGATGLSACLEANEGDDDTISAPVGGDPDTRPDRQHAWNDVLGRDEDGNVRPPAHHVFLALELTATPGPDARQGFETALAELDRALAWGPEGLLFTVGYTPAYFDRFDASLPAGLDLPAPTTLTELETPETVEFDTQDALLHLASDDPAVVLAAEEALLGNRETLNGREIEASLDGIAGRSGRRTGFVGPGLPAEKQDDAEIRGLPDREITEEAPFWMGYRSGFAESQATEARVTLESGPFAGGTTQHLESLRLQLGTWWDQDSHFDRVSQLFSPDHAEEGRVGVFGERLETSTGALEVADQTAADAVDPGVVGHAQKAARAREDGEPPLLRRDVNTADGDYPGVHFLALQDGIGTYERVRQAMAGQDLAEAGAVGTRENNGILQYITVVSRGNYLLPPRRHRALPRPDP